MIHHLDSNSVIDPDRGAHQHQQQYKYPQRGTGFFSLQLSHSISEGELKPKLRDWLSVEASMGSITLCATLHNWRYTIGILGKKY
jgi:hypothetical protein